MKHKNGLYREQMRLLSVPMLVVLFLFFLISVIQYLAGGMNVRAESIESLNLVLYLYPYVAGLVAALVSFLRYNYRVNCDYWFAIPASRTALYVASALAAATWIAIGAFTTLLPTVLLACWDGINGVMLLHTLLLFGYAFLTALSIYAGCAIGCNLGGRGFMNFIHCVFIVFYPCILVLAAKGMFTMGNFHDFTMETLDFATGLPLMVISANFVEPMFLSPVPYLWTFAIALVELVLGWLLFVRRRAELAGKPAHSDRLQNVYSAILVAPAFLLLMALLIEDYSTHWTFDKLELFLAWWKMGVTLLLLSLMLFILYQSISKKSFRKAWRAIGWWGISLAASVVLMIGVHQLGGLLYEHPTIKAESIEHLQINLSANRSEWTGVADSVQRPDVIELDHSTVRKYVSRYEHEFDYATEEICQFVEDHFETKEGQYVVGIIASLRNGKVVDGRLYMTQEEAKELGSMMRQANVKEQMPLPEQVRDANLLPVGSEEDALMLYSIIREELLSPADEPISGSAYNNTTMTVFGYDGLSYFRMDVPIHAQITPRAARFCLEREQEEATNRMTILNEAIREGSLWVDWIRIDTERFEVRGDRQYRGEQDQEQMNRLLLSISPLEVTEASELPTGLSSGTAAIDIPVTVEQLAPDTDTEVSFEELYSFLSNGSIPTAPENCDIYLTVCAFMGEGVYQELSFHLDLTDQEEQAFNNWLWERFLSGQNDA